MHGKTLQMLFHDQDVSINQDKNLLEFVILPDGPYVQSQNAIQTLTNNLRINGFTLENHGRGSSTLAGHVYSNGAMHKINIIIRDHFPPSVFTIDDIILTTNGITIKSFNQSKDTVNMSKGVGVIDRLFSLWSSELVASDIILPYNQYKTHRDHNVVILKSVDEACSNGYVVRDINIDVQQVNEYECPVCLESGRHCTQLSCGHKFCLKCTEKILSNDSSSPRCALCRSELVFTMA